MVVVSRCVHVGPSHHSNHDRHYVQLFSLVVVCGDSMCMLGLFPLLLANVIVLASMAPNWYR